MAYSRVNAILEIDNAHADGMVTTKGIGRDWEAAQVRDENAGFTPDIGGQYGWDLDGSGVEYIKPLRAMAPRGGFSFSNMDISQWTVIGGAWQEYWAARPGYKMLHFYNGATGLVGNDEYGIITSNSSFTPNLVFRVWRFPPRSDDVDAQLFEIVFQGDGVAPEYILGFPAWTQTDAYYQAKFRSLERAYGYASSEGFYTNPFLAGRPQGEAYWAVIDKLDAGSRPAGAHLQSEAILQTIKIEQTADSLLVQIDDNEIWVYSGEWQSQAGRDVDFGITQGPIQIRAIGHTVMFQLSQLEYDSTNVLYPRKYFFVPADYNQTPSYRLINYVPSGTGMSVEADAESAAKTRPKVTFTSAYNNDRAVLYCVQEHRAATIGGAVSSPVSTQANSEFSLMSANGRMDDSWKGGELTAEIEAQHGFDLAVVGANAKVSARVSTDDGATFQTQFTGYTAAPERLAPSGVKPALVTLQANDLIEARLSKKMMDWHPSYEAVPENEAVEEILNRAGVPPALINVDASLTDDLPSGTMKGARRLKFRPDVDPISALNTIAEVRNRQWGVGWDGVAFWHERVEHPSGYYHWTLDASTAVPERVAESIYSARSIADFSNWLKVMTGEGLDAAAKILSDETSISDSTARRFLGDIWERIEMRPDGDDADALANAIWPEINTLSDIIRWTMWDESWLMPGHYVRVLAPDADIPTGDVYGIIAKSWSTEENGRYVQELEAKLVEAA